jgi:vacuolar-type H+-ATPase subunit E/Vma4
MLRIALILALLTAAGALVVTQFVAKPKVVELDENLKTTTENLNQTTTAKNKAESEAKAAKAAAEATAKELATTKTERDTAQEEATKQTARADKLNNDLTTVTKARNEAQQELAQWQALSIKPDQVRVLQADLKKTTEQRDELEVLKKGAEKMLARTEAELRKYKGDDTVVEMPGLKGTVVSADSQWNFVVLDVGENGGAKPGGIVMVRRGDKLVGKAKIMTVEANRSIANLLPGWQQGDVAVAAGDAVLY